MENSLLAAVSAGGSRSPPPHSLLVGVVCLPSFIGEKKVGDVSGEKGVETITKGYRCSACTEYFCFVSSNNFPTKELHLC